MVHFQDKTHLILWLEKNCVRKAIVRALYEGQVELLGGFRPIPPTSQPGWILKVTSAHDKTWNVAIIMYQQRYGIRILKDVPWKNWVGDYSWQPNLYNGDDPQKYSCKRLHATPVKWGD